MLYKYKSAYEDMYVSLQALKDMGHTLLFVFDGKAPVEKAEEVKDRRDVREAAIQQATILKDQLNSNTITVKERQILEYSVARLEFQGWHMTREIRHAFQKGLFKMGIPYVKAIYEADDVLVDLALAKKLGVIVSTDMDYLLSGVQRMWIPNHKSCEQFEEILQEEVLKGEGLTQAAFLDAGILCGVEPLRGKLSINSFTAFNWIRYYKNIESLLCSNVKDSRLDILREELPRVRAHFEPRLWDTRIRPDHLESCKSFLTSL
jgi:5'-3' exonuclease